MHYFVRKYLSDIEERSELKKTVCCLPCAFYILFCILYVIVIGCIIAFARN